MIEERIDEGRGEARWDSELDLASCCRWSDDIDGSMIEIGKEGIGLVIDC